MDLKKYFSRLYPIILYILKIHITSLIIFATIRATLLITNIHNIGEADYKYIVKAFYLGFFIDNIVASFISLFPIIFSGVISFFSDTYKKAFQYGYNIYFIVIYTLFFGLSISDIPYFNYFYKHIDSSILDWLKNDTEGYKMIINETGYYKFYLMFILIISIFTICVIYFSRVWRNYQSYKPHSNKYEFLKYIILFVFFATLCFMGLRRKYGFMYPITHWTTHLSPSSFANALSTNAIYNYGLGLTTIKHKDKEITFGPSLDESIELLKQDFKNKEFIESTSPISRMIRTEGDQLIANVVIVLMESMSSYYITETPHLTPYLNQLKDKSYYFDNFFSVSTHTSQGAFSILYGFPAFFQRIITENRPESGYTQAPLCEGLPTLLNEKGYLSSYFMSHVKSYNNMDMFFYKNGYDTNQLYSLVDYPISKVKTTWGVSDDYLFEYATNIFNSQKDKPFFGTIMTISNHPEYYVPEEFKTISNKEHERAVYFADHSIGEFMENAQKLDWYNNTIFLFVGDHGRLEGNQLFEMPLSLNHVPMIIYSPLFEGRAKTISTLGSQIDIFPTIMGLLNIEYENNSMGIDLFKEERPYVVFTNDDKLACLSHDYLYCYNTISELEFLYDYKGRSPLNIASKQPFVLDSMRNYASATVKVTNYILNNNLARRNKDKND